MPRDNRFSLACLSGMSTVRIPDGSAGYDPGARAIATRKPLICCRYTSQRPWRDPLWRIARGDVPNHVPDCPPLFPGLPAIVVRVVFRHACCALRSVHSRRVSGDVQLSDAVEKLRDRIPRRRGHAQHIRSDRRHTCEAKRSGEARHDTFSDRSHTFSVQSRSAAGIADPGRAAGPTTQSQLRAGHRQRRGAHEAICFPHPAAGRLPKDDEPRRPIRIPAPGYSGSIRNGPNQLQAAKASQLSAKLAMDSEIGGINTAVAQTRAQLEHAKWELDQTTIRAPGDGYVTVLALAVGDRALQARSVM